MRRQTLNAARAGVQFTLSRNPVGVSEFPKVQDALNRSVLNLFCTVGLTMSVKAPGSRLEMAAATVGATVTQQLGECPGVLSKTYIF